MNLWQFWKSTTTWLLLLTLNTHFYPDYLSFVKIQAKYTGKHDLKIKNVEFFKFWDNKPNRKFLCPTMPTAPDIYVFVRLQSRNWSRSFSQITKLKPKPKLWVFETTKLKPKLWPQMLRLHETEAEAAWYPCLDSTGLALARTNPIVPRVAWMNPAWNQSGLVIWDMMLNITFIEIGGIRLYKIGWWYYVFPLWNGFIYKFAIPRISFFYYYYYF